MFRTVSAEKKEAFAAWLFPITYLLHVSEEYYAGAALALSPDKLRGANLKPSQFLILNIIAAALLFLGIIISRRFKFRQPLLACLGTIVLVNGLFHVLGAIKIAGYNPGLISGAFVWVPLGVITLIQMRTKVKTVRYWQAIACGIGITALVMLLARRGGVLFS